MAAVGLCVLLAVAILVAGPLLREATFGRDQSPGTREVVATGEAADQLWEAVATDDENGTCIAVEFPPLRPAGTCARIAEDPPLHAVRVAEPPVGGASVLMAVVRDDVTAVRAVLADGDPVTLDVLDTDADYPNGFAVGALPQDATLTAVEVLGADGEVVDRQPYSGGQG